MSFDSCRHSGVGDAEPRAIGRVVCVLLLVGWGAWVAPVAADSGTDFFEAKIRPVLVASCYECHSADAASRKKLKADLLLDSKPGMLKGGDSGPVIVPGKPKESLLLRTLKWEGDLKMPPKQKLPPEVVADFEKWIADGAVDPRITEGEVKTNKRIIDAKVIEDGRKLWAFTRLLPAKPPAVKDQAWAKTPVDRFILSQLEGKGIVPVASASRSQLVRRATYDLTGLPPTPEEIDAFLKDCEAAGGSADAVPQAAFEKLVDRLLASERYGERWARHWLDIVRYAESGGYEFDGNRNGAFHYRDFVIKALNDDMPYDEFLRLQLAGDLIKPGDYWSTAASGFMVAGPYPGQTTAKTLEIIRYDHLDDMIATMGSSMLGLSLACTRCHEHKYDPIAQDDYYKLIAAFSKTDSVEAKVDPKPEIYAKAKAAFDAAHAPLAAAQEKYEKEQLPGKLAAWFAARAAKDAAPQAPAGWLVLDAALGDKKPARKLDDGSLLIEGKPGKTETYTITAQTWQRGINAIRIEAMPDAALPKSGPGRAADAGFALSEMTVTATPLKQGSKDKPVQAKLKPVAASIEAADGKLAAAVDGDAKTGWSVPGIGIEGKRVAAVFQSEQVLGFEGGATLTIVLKFERDGQSIGRPRVAIASTPGAVSVAAASLDDPGKPQREAELLAVLAPIAGQLNGENRATVLRWFRAIDGEANAIYAAVEASSAKAPQPNLVGVFAASERNGTKVHFLIRGEVDRKGPAAVPGYVDVLTQSSDGAARWLGKDGKDSKSSPAAHPRIALGRWMTDSDAGAGHLAARVIVNRLWQHHFGRGIVATPNDFGAQGESATHPELLDFLAGELIRGGWRLKPVHKLIMLSAVYQLGNGVNDAGLKHDPTNKLFWRRAPRRLEAEAIRDAVLAVGGTLDTTMYGDGPLDANSNRRSVYLKVKRSQHVPMMQIFDAPEAIQSLGVRTTTTVATQALTMMNSPLVRSRAVSLAKRIKPATPDKLGESIEQAYRITLGRKPAATELQRMTAFAGAQAQSYGNAAAGLDLAMADVCQLLICSNEFVYVD